MVSVHPARRRTSPLGVEPVGLGDGVGDCHDACYIFFGRENFTLFLRIWLLIFMFWWVLLSGHTGLAEPL